MAAAAGLVLAERWSAWDGTPFTASSTHHVSRVPPSRRGPRLGWEHSEPAQTEPSERAVGHHRRRAGQAPVRLRPPQPAGGGRPDAGLPLLPGLARTPRRRRSRRSGRDGAWQVRVVPNRYPGVRGRGLDGGAQPRSRARAGRRQRHPRGHRPLARPHGELEGPRRRRRRHGDGGAAQPHGRAGAPRQHPLHAGHRQPGPGGRRVAHPPARPAPRHALRARRDRRRGAGLRPLRGRLHPVRHRRGRAGRRRPRGRGQRRRGRALPVLERHALRDAGHPDAARGPPLRLARRPRWPRSAAPSATR